MSIRAGQKVSISIKPVDRFGNAARVDGIPAWAVSDESLGSLEITADGNTAILSSIGKVGSITVGVSADVDLSPEVRTLDGSVTIDIEPGEAVDLGVFAEPIVIDVAPTEAPAADTTAPATGNFAPEVPVADVAPVGDAGVTDTTV